MQPATAQHSRPVRPATPRSAELEARYGRLFQKLSGPARGMVRRAFGSAFSDDELDDLYSSAWLSTLAALDRKPRDLSDEELRRYLMTSVANQASREMRRRGRKPTLPIEVALGASDPAVAPDEAATQAEHAQITRDVLGSLPPRRRAVMVFRYGWGLEPKEVCGLVDGLSPRAYRKEVERGVSEVVSKMRMVEGGEWCESREPVLRAVAAGLADEEEMRQARQHLAHCRSCTGFVNRLTDHLHELATPLALSGVAESLELGGGSVLDRIGEMVERGKQTAGSIFARGTEGADQAASQLVASGGTRGAGVAGAGAMAKLAGLGAVPKLVAACVGTGAAATACVAAGVVPGINLDRETSNRPVAQRGDAQRDRSDVVRHRTLGTIHAGPPEDPAPRPTPEAKGDAPPGPGPESNPTPEVDDPPTQSAPPPAPVSPTTEEFEPVGTPIESTATPPASGSATGSGGGGGRTTGGDFGP